MFLGYGRKLAGMYNVKNTSSSDPPAPAPGLLCQHITTAAAAVAAGQKLPANVQTKPPVIRYGASWRAHGRAVCVLVVPWFACGLLKFSVWVVPEHLMTSSPARSRLFCGYKSFPAHPPHTPYPYTRTRRARDGMLMLFLFFGSLQLVLGPHP